MTPVSEAVVLMAGSGSRLRGADVALLKPLIRLRGRPLIVYTLDALVRAGIEKINFIVGYQSARMIAAVEPLVPRQLKCAFIENLEWQKQNGISLLAASKHVKGPFLLSMSDHLFDNAIVDLLLESADLQLLSVAIDRKINSIFDLDDAMKVQTRGRKIVAIGKTLHEYDAIDIGLCVCPLEFFKYLADAKQNDDCSLADGIRLMAVDGKVRAVEIGDGWWQDVDTPEMLEHAKQAMNRVRAQTWAK
jgi:choline kinase